MDPRFRHDQRFPSPDGGYFSFQAMRVGFRDGEPMRPRPMMEALEMELRAERLKEEIIARRIAQRRMVEEQTRREMEIARAMGMRGGRMMDPFLLGGPIEGPSAERRFGPWREHQPRFGPRVNRAFLEEINDDVITEEVDFPRRRFGPQRNGPAVVDRRRFRGRNVEFEARGRSGPLIGWRNVGPDETLARREEGNGEVKMAPWSNKQEVNTSIETIPPNVSGTKRKPMSPFTGGTGSCKFPRPAHKDWSCALCQVSATCEEGLNEHLQGKKHQAKVAQLGSDSRNNHTVTTPYVPKENQVIENSPPMKEAKKVAIKLDGRLYKVMEKGRHLWCTICKFKCQNQAAMIDHLTGKKHLLEEDLQNMKKDSIETPVSEDVIKEDLQNMKEDNIDTPVSEEVVKECEEEELQPGPEETTADVADTEE